MRRPGRTLLMLAGLLLAAGLAVLTACALVLAWGLHHAAGLGGKPQRVFVMGHSAGASNAAMLTLDAGRLARTGHAPGALAGWIGLAGPCDFFPMTKPDAQPVFVLPNDPPRTQPVDFAGALSPRSFLAAAEVDSLINPQRNSVGLANRRRAAGAPVALKQYWRVDHMTLVAALAGPQAWLAPVRDDVLGFINAGPALAGLAGPGLSPPSPRTP